MPSARVAVIVAGLLVAYLGIGIGQAVNAPAEAIEGHTVFVSISNMSNVEGRTGFAAAVAVLVRQQDTPLVGRMPGVLWFNDQYLVAPESNAGNKWTTYPCTGVVIAVERGDPDPRTGVALTGDARYEESYRITDPNDRAWDIDRWNITTDKGFSSYAWTVAIGNRVEASTLYDDGGGASCDPVVDRGCPLPVEQTACYQQQPLNRGEVEHPDLEDPCLPPECGSLRYNALLFFWLDDLRNSGTPVNHTRGNESDDHVPGCHEDDPEFGCPDGDDDAEGNSHLVFDPLANDAIEPGSADCSEDSRDRFDENCHRTVAIDIYYGTAPQPLERNYVLYDGEGRTEAIGCTELSAALGVCLP